MPNAGRSKEETRTAGKLYNRESIFSEEEESTGVKEGGGSRAQVLKGGCEKKNENPMTYVLAEDERRTVREG